MHKTSSAVEIKIDQIFAIRNEKQDILQEEEEKIIGVVKPIGFWTAKIFGERIATIIAQAESMKKGESTKFWQNFVKASNAQARFQEKSKQR